MTEHETAEEAFSNNRERLRAERLAREAVEGPMLTPAPELPNDTPIEKVRFSTRIRNALTAAGWKTIGEIREASDEALLGIQDLGKGPCPTSGKRWVCHRLTACGQVTG